MTAPARVSLYISPTTEDLVFEGNSLKLVFDAEAVGQHARQRVTTFQGEWFLNTDAGVPWLNRIFAQAYDPALAEAVTKAALLSTDGVVDITSFSVSFNLASRGLRIKDVSLTTDYEEVVNL